MKLYGKHYKPGDLEEIMTVLESSDEERTAKGLRPLRYEECYECEAFELHSYCLSEDEWLAHITELYCKHNLRIPNEEEWEWWLDIHCTLMNLVDFESDKWSGDVFVRFWLDGAFPTVQFYNERKSATAHFFAMNDEYYKEEIPDVYCWDKYYDKLNEYLNVDSSDTEPKDWVFVMDKSSIDSRPENYYRVSTQTIDWDSTKGLNFANTLRLLIQESGMTEPECYNKAQVSRAVFSSLMNPRRSIQPSRRTVYSFAIALELTISETDRLLSKAGMCFADSSDNMNWERIVRNEIENDNYDIFSINEKLYDAGEHIL